MELKHHIPAVHILHAAEAPARVPYNSCPQLRTHTGGAPCSHAPPGLTFTAPGLAVSRGGQGLMVVLLAPLGLWPQVIRLSRALALGGGRAPLLNDWLHLQPHSSESLPAHLLTASLWKFGRGHLWKGMAQASPGCRCRHRRRRRSSSSAPTATNQKQLQCPAKASHAADKQRPGSGRSCSAANTCPSVLLHLQSGQAHALPTMALTFAMSICGAGRVSWSPPAMP